MSLRVKIATIFVLCVSLSGAAFLAQQPGEHGALGERLDQLLIEQMTVTQAANEGLRLFTTPFNKIDGYGDGPIDPVDTVDPGGRPTLQGNGTLLRINGLDAQACFECHTLVSNATIPATLGIGGAGGSNSNAIIMPSQAIDVADLIDLDGEAGFNGRFANPPFMFGVGGVELIGLEMTADLQALKAEAIANPGTPVALVAKGVEFGSITADTFGSVDTSLVKGVDDDLVIRPFGRKGEFATTRDFDLGAMRFHFGMEPVEEVGEDFDHDGDGVVNEISVGEISALSVFLSTLRRPEQDRLDGDGVQGEALFATMGCSDCHMPALDSETTNLPLRFPQIATSPFANIYKSIDLSKPPMRFPRNAAGGVRVQMFSDLKRHDMGDGLAEDFALMTPEQNREFITAKLWGVADSGPWLHDGRALTISDAILAHGGDAQLARDQFDALSAADREAVLSFLRALRTPQPEPARNNPRAIRSLGNDASSGAHAINRR
jgi:mono/diheme cytochrome c family protein